MTGCLLGLEMINTMKSLSSAPTKSNPPQATTRLRDNDIRFSRSAQRVVQQSRSAQQQSVLRGTKDWLAGKGDDVMPAALVC